MPIVDVQFQDGILYACEVGYVTADDAQEWVQALNQHAQHSPTPIRLLIDACQATTICNDARKIFAKASDTPNVLVSAIVVNPEKFARCPALTDNGYARVYPQNA